MKWENVLVGSMAGIFLVVVFLGVFFGLSALFAAAFWFLWNHVAVSAFSAHPLSYWQSFGIVLLISLVGSLLKGVVISKK